MYFRENDKPVENYTQPSVENFQVGDKFPRWLLSIVIGIISIIGLFFIFKLRHDKKGQNFGFRFY